MGFDDAELPQHQQQDEQADRDPNAEAQRFEGTAVLTTILDHVEQSREKTRENAQENDDNDYFFHGEYLQQ